MSDGECRVKKRRIDEEDDEDNGNWRREMMQVRARG